MPLHLVKFVDDPTSSSPVELGACFADSLDDALAKAQASIAEYKSKHSTAEYRIEDATGRTVWIGPGTYDPA
jgi:hypothetical protein